MTELSVRIGSSLHAVSQAEWNELIVTSDGVGDADNPFVDWRFLTALEDSGCAVAARGWLPCPFAVYSGRTLLAVAPAYIKQDSEGDFSRDWDWAAAAEQARLSYYPKLVFCVPYTPVTGRRLLLRSQLSASERQPIFAALVHAARRFCQDQGIASMHVLFPTETQQRELTEQGLLPRVAFQYHWRNPGYRDPEEFYARFSSKRRNALKRERAAAQTQGISLRTIRGDEIARDPATYADLAHALHSSTVEKLIWGRRWLNQGFYRQLFSSHPDAIELVVAERQGRVIAGAFNVASDVAMPSVRSADTVSQRRLYGRYWGCFEEHPFLHFNVCYYHSIDACIQRRVAIFEGGAGGEHKIARGFEPCETYSAHSFFDPRLEAALRRHLQHERAARTQAISAYREQAPVLKTWSPEPAAD